MISYAQNFEDVMLNRVFKTQSSGFYIDVGAADPTNLSVTKWFYDNGWNGINVEPVREFSDLLTLARPRDINLNCGAGAASGEMRFREYSVKEWSTFDLDGQSAPRDAEGDVRETIVPVKTLNQIIEENASTKQIDFLKIDVEGWEEQVLRGIDLRKYRPTVILIEAIDRDSGELVSAAADKLLSDAGYLSVYFDGINKFYVPDERSDLAKSFSSPPNIFDDFKPHKEVELEKVAELQRAELGQARTDMKTLTRMVKEQEALSTARYTQVEYLTRVVDEFAWYAETAFGRAIRPVLAFFKKARKSIKRPASKK